MGSEMCIRDRVSTTKDVLVTIQGFAQTPDIDYSLLGTTGISFNTGIISGQEVNIRHLAMGPSGVAGPTGPAGPAGVSVTGVGIASNNLFTGDGTTTIYAIGSNVSHVKDVMVSVEGLTQTPRQTIL